MEPLLDKDWLLQPNTGLRDEAERPLGEIQEESLFGGVLEVTNINADWRPFLPTHEQQYNKYFDTSGCTNFTATNMVEVLGIKKFGREFNYSDRQNAVASGTRYGVGNWASSALNTIKRDGLVLETDYPWSADVTTPEKYYAPLPQFIKDKAKLWLNEWEFDWGWYEASQYGHRKTLREALKFSPIGISIPSGSYKDADGVYHTTSEVFGHRVTALYVYEDGKIDILDHYMQVRTLSKDFPFGWSAYITLNEKHPFDKYRGKLVKNTTSNKVYWVGTVTGKLIWIENPAKFEFGRDESLWGDWADIIDVPEPIEDYITF